MSAAYIVSACRTPIGKFGGQLSTVSTTQLGAVAVRGAVERSGYAPSDVDEVILGTVLAGGLGQAPARQAALGAGLLDQVAALTVNKVCGSGLKAVMLAAQAIQSGDAKLVVAGGMECMSQAGWFLPRKLPALGTAPLTDLLMHDGLTCPFSGRSMGDIAESLAGRAKISREDQDRFALESHRRAVAAQQSGAFAAEIVPVPVPQKGEVLAVSADEGPRPDAALERLAKLRPSFRADGTVTAGNASMISDGAAALTIVSEEMLRKAGIRPLARIVAFGTVGTAPEEVFTAPVEGIRQTLDKAGWSVSDVDLFELNEAFAAQMLGCVRPLELPLDRVNVDGGAIALGHPIGASGARVLTTLVHALQRRDARRGIASLCLGGGNAVTMAVERVI